MYIITAVHIIVSSTVYMILGNTLDCSEQAVCGLTDLVDNDLVDNDLVDND